VHGKGKVPRHDLGSGGPACLLFLKEVKVFFASFFKILKPKLSMTESSILLDWEL